MMSSMWKNCLFVFLLITLGGCGSRSSLVRSWSDPQQVVPVQDVLVVGISKNEAAVRLWERIFVQAFAERGVKASSAIEITGFMPEPDKAVLQKAIRKSGADEVLITHILDRSSTTYTRPGYVRYVPGGLYRNLYGYYGHAYRAVYLPPQDVTRTTVLLETNLYNARSGQLLWSGQTRSRDPRLLKSDFGELVTLMLDDLAQKGLLTK